MKPKRPFTELTEEGRLRVLGDIAELCLRSLTGKLKAQKALETISEKIKLVEAGFAYSLTHNKPKEVVVPLKMDAKSMLANMIAAHDYRDRD